MINAQVLWEEKCSPFHPRKRLEGTDMATEEEEALHMT
jgi:hypothetical protein